MQTLNRFNFISFKTKFNSVSASLRLMGPARLRLMGSAIILFPGFNILGFKPPQVTVTVSSFREMEINNSKIQF